MTWCDISVFLLGRKNNNYLIAFEIEIRYALCVMRYEFGRKHQAEINLCLICGHLWSASWRMVSNGSQYIIRYTEFHRAAARGTELRRELKVVKLKVLKFMSEIRILCGSLWLLCGPLCKKTGKINSLHIVKLSRCAAGRSYELIVMSYKL